MAEIETKIGPPSIDSSLARRDYHWIEISPEEFARMLAEKLKSVNAKVWFLDVYCSNDQIYRNLAVKWQGYGSSVKSLRIRFDRGEGYTLDIRIED